jgi:hypothetical protein
MRNHISGGPELLDDLEPARLLYEHPLALIIRVAHPDDKPGRHAPNELALVERERDKLLASRIRTFTDELDLGVFGTLESPFVDLPP